MTIRLLAYVLVLLLSACAGLTTENPSDPKADDPIVLGEEVMPPLGCQWWRIDREDADC